MNIKRKVTRGQVWRGYRVLDGIQRISYMRWGGHGVSRKKRRRIKVEIWEMKCGGNAISEIALEPR